MGLALSLTTAHATRKKLSYFGSNTPSSHMKSGRTHLLCERGEHCSRNMQELPHAAGPTNKREGKKKKKKIQSTSKSKTKKKKKIFYYPGRNCQRG